MTRQEERRRHFAAKRERAASGVRQFKALGLQAKRRDTGDYEYRGYRIFDRGAGRSVHAAIERGGMRWSIRKITGPGYFESEPAGRAYTYKEAKEKVDRMLNKAAAPKPVTT